MDAEKRGRQQPQNKREQRQRAASLSLSASSSASALRPFRSTFSKTIAMKTYPGILNLEQISSSVLSSSSNHKCSERETVNLPELGVKEVTCAEPQGASNIVDVCNRPCCRPRRNSPPPIDNLHNILNSVLTKDDLDYELDDNTGCLGLLDFSPPVRTKNPLINDVQFVHQNRVKNSLLGNFIRGTEYHSGVKVSCHRTSEETPTIRIEGFDSGSSKSQ